MPKSKLLSKLLEQSRYPIDRRERVELTENALRVLGKKYLKGETPEEMFNRVANAIASPLKESIPVGEGILHAQIVTVFYNMMATGDFLPNSPTLINAGRAFNQLAACFVVPVEDSMEGIFREAIADMAMIQRTGGGTGFDFSELRPRGAIVSSTQGESSGPIPFMRAFNACTDTIKQGGARRGANMGVLRVDHPDIREFIMLKTDLTEMTNFNLSVAVTDAFMEAVKAGTKYDLVHNGKVYGQEDAEAIWDLLSERAWSSGEPGVLFIDTINASNTLPGLGNITATNPCGEQPLLPYEACNLGSINLSRFVSGDVIDFAELAEVAQLATLFLDCAIDAGTYPDDKITAMAQANRKIGLGVMGFADACFDLAIGYDSSDAKNLAGNIMSCITKNARLVSEQMGKVFGSFPNLEKSIYKTPRRNATLTTIAPTGTISIIADTSYGIEPAFALSYTKVLTDTDETIAFVNKYIYKFMEARNFDTLLADSVEGYILKHGSIKGIYETLKSIAKNNATDLMVMEEVFITAQDIAPVDHLHIQMAFQKYVDNAVSKTINFQNDVTKEDIRKIFERAHTFKLKGVTVYRDGCRDSQPLQVNREATEEEYATTLTPKPLKRPSQLSGITRQIPTGCGMMLVTVNMDEDGEVYEVLMRAGASGGCSAYTDATARLISIGLRHGVPLDVLIDQLRSVRCDNFRYQAGKDASLKGKSCPDTVGRFLQDIVDGKSGTNGEEMISVSMLNGLIQEAFENASPPTGAENSTLCPECGKSLLRAEGCLTCTCGFSRC